MSKATGTLQLETSIMGGNFSNIQSMLALFSEIFERNALLDICRNRDFDSVPD
jgi:hypothetical protein